MEELFLGLFTAADEVHVVDEQQIGLAVLAAEEVRGPLVDGRDQIVHELFGGDIDDAGGGIALEDVVGDALHQMGLSEAGGTVDEERIVGRTGLLRDRRRRRRRELIGLTDDEIVERIPYRQ